MGVLSDLKEEQEVPKSSLGNKACVPMMLAVSGPMLKKEDNRFHKLHQKIQDNSGITCVLL
jgi:hypothetical protein